VRGQRIQIVIPAKAGRRSGNRVTALRWRKCLESLGHRVAIETEYRGGRCDVLIALHAHRSAAAALRYRHECPSGRLVVALSGTDLYRDLDRSPRGHQALDAADRIVLLQRHGLTRLDRSLHKRCRVIHQSVVVPKRLPGKARRSWQVAVVGHLRPVKDPFLAARAVRDLPSESRIRVVHLGGALQQRMRVRAEAQMQRQPGRYCWMGNRPHWQVMRQLARSQVLVLSSHMEGGANVVGEAISVGTPVLSTRISGSIGLLGEDYPGFFEPGDVDGLRRLLLDAESPGPLYQSISERCAALKSQFHPSHERRSWQQLLTDSRSGCA